MVNLNGFWSSTARTQFATLLADHLARGTRPSTAAGEPWTYTEFAGEIPGARANQYVSERTVSNWCKGLALPGQIEPILRALFGPTSGARHAEARGALLDAFRAAKVESRTATVDSNTLERSRRIDPPDSTTASAQSDPLISTEVEAVHIGTPRLEIVISQNHRFEGGHEKAIELIADFMIATARGTSPVISVTMRALGAELSRYRAFVTDASSGKLSAQDKKNLLELRDILRADDLLETYAGKDTLKDELIAREVTVLLNEFRIKKDVFTRHEELATAVLSLVELEAGAQVAENLITGFDVVHPDTNHSFVVYLPDDKFENLCRKVGIPPLPVHALSFYGLDLFDLGRDVLVAQAIPKIVQSFVRAQMKGDPLDARSFLNQNAWRVGLH
jgi:hypothetical protein